MKKSMTAFYHLLILYTILYNCTYSKAAQCYPTVFPRILGGVNDITIFQAMDYNPNTEEFVLGGKSYDPDIVSVNQMPNAFVLLMSPGGLYKWSKQFTASAHDRVSHISFNQDYTKIVVTVQPFALIVLSSSSGSILRKYAETSSFGGITNVNGFSIDSQDRVALAMQSSTFKWQYVQIQLTSSSISPEFIQRSYTGPSTANIALFDLLECHVHISGIMRTSKYIYASLTRIDTLTGSIRLNYGLEQPRQSNYLTIQQLAYILDSSNNALFATLEHYNADATQYEYPLRLMRVLIVDQLFKTPIHATFPRMSNDLNSNVYRCVQLKALSSYKMIMLIDDVNMNEAYYGEVSFNAAVFPLGSFKYKKLEFFSQDSHQMYHGYLSPTLNFYCGSARTVTPSPSITLPFNFGYLMTLDYSDTCYSTISNPLITVDLTRIFIPLVSISDQINRVSTAWITPSETLVMPMSVIKTESSCPYSPVTVISSTLSTKTYEIYSGSYSFIIPAFTTSNFGCSDTNFIYRVSMLDGTNIPYFMQYTTASRRLRYQTSNLNDIGIYSLQVQGYLTNGQPITKQLDINVIDPCSTLTTPVQSSTYQDLTYVVGQPPIYLSPMSLWTATIVQCSLIMTLEEELQTSPLSYIIPPIELISINSNNQEISIYTDNEALAHTYSMVVYGEVLGANSFSTLSIETFNLIIYSPCEDPDLLIPQQIENYYLRAINSENYAGIPRFKIQWQKSITSSCQNAIEYSIQAADISVASPQYVFLTIEAGNIFSTNHGTISSGQDEYGVTITAWIAGYKLSTSVSKTFHFFMIAPNFNLNCDKIRIFPSILYETYEYIIGGSDLVIIFDDWLERGTMACYSFVYTQISYASKSMVGVVQIFDGTQRTFQYGSSSQLDSGLMLSVSLKGRVTTDSTISRTVNFNVKFISPCQPPISILSQLIPSDSLPTTTQYFITDPINYIPMPFYQVLPTPLYTQCGVIQYEVVNYDSTVIDSSIFNFNTVTNKLEIYSQDETKSGKYMLKYNVYMTEYPNYKSSVYFEVEVVNECLHDIILPAADVSMDVKIGVNGVISLSDFDSYISNCGSFTFTCHMISPNPGTCDTQLYSIDSSLKKLTIYTSDISYLSKTHILQIYGNQQVTDTLGMQITITFTSDLCKNAYITSFPILTSITSYDVAYNQRIEVFSNLEWEQSDLECPQITYKLKDLERVAADTEIFSFNSITGALSIYTTNPEKARTYLLQVNAIMGSFSQSEDFQLVVTNICPTANFGLTPLVSMNFDIGSVLSPVIQEFDHWTINYAMCGDITYSLKRRDGKPKDPFITFDASNLQISLFSKTPAHAGMYQYEIVGKIPAKSVSVNFDVKITYTCGDAKPIPTIIEDSVYFIGSGSKIIMFEPWIDSVGYCGEIKYSANANDKSLPAYIAFDPTARTFKIETKNAALDQISLKINIIGTLVMTKVEAKSSFVLDLIKLSNDDATAVAEILESQFSISLNSTKNTKKKVQIRPTLNANITEIDFNQRVTIVFNKNMMIPKKYEILEKSKSLQFTIIQSPGGRILNNIITKWKILSYSGDTIKIQLYMEDPSILSVSKEYDKLRIVFKVNTLYLSELEDESIPSSYAITRQIPPQLMNTTSARMLQSVATAASATLSGSVSTNLILSIFLGASLKKVWMLMNTLQILVNIPLLSVTLPSNALFLFQTLVELSRMNLIPKAQIKAFLKSIHLGGSSNNKQESMAGNFKVMGIENCNLFENMGLIFIALIALVVAAILLLLMKFLIQRFKFIQKYYLKMHQKIFFNSFLRSIQKGYLNFAIATMITLQIAPDDQQQQIAGALIAIILLLTPIGTFLFFKHYFKRLDEDDYNLRFGSLYLNLRTDTQSCLRHTVLYFIRRLMYSISIVFLSDYPFAQYTLFICTSLILLAFQFAVKPMEDRVTQMIEIYNETTIMLIGTILAPFAADAFDMDSRKESANYGWIIIFLTLSNILVNQLAVMIAVFIKLYQTIRKLIWKWKNRKLLKAKKAQDKLSQSIYTTPIEDISHNISVNKQEQQQSEKQQQFIKPYKHYRFQSPEMKIVDDQFLKTFENKPLVDVVDYFAPQFGSKPDDICNNNSVSPIMYENKQLQIVERKSLDLVRTVNELKAHFEGKVTVQRFGGGSKRPRVDSMQNKQSRNLWQ